MVKVKWAIDEIRAKAVAGGFVDDVDFKGYAGVLIGGNFFSRRHILSGELDQHLSHPIQQEEEETQNEGMDLSTQPSAHPQPPDDAVATPRGGGGARRRGRGQGGARGRGRRKRGRRGGDAVHLRRGGKGGREEGS